MLCFFSRFIESFFRIFSESFAKGKRVGQDFRPLINDFVHPNSVLNPIFQETKNQNPPVFSTFWFYRAPNFNLSNIRPKFVETIPSLCQALD